MSEIFQGETPLYQNVPPPPPPKSPFRGLIGCLSMIGIATIVIAVLLVVGVFSLMKSCSEEMSESADQLFSSNFTEEASTEYMEGRIDSENMIAVIPVEGVIMSGSESMFDTEVANSDRIVRTIQLAAEDENVKAIVIQLNTPGGEVTASDEIYHALKTCGKPVVAQMRSLAASGGYYVASAAQKIVANRQTLTGSIGVIISTFNYSQLLTHIYIEPEVYTSGKMKAMLNGALATGQEEKILVQNLVNSSYADFVQIVSESRHIPVEKITGSELGDGRVFDGRQAKELGLVDQLGYFRDAAEAAAELAHLPKNDWQAVKYEIKGSLLHALMSIKSDLAGGKKVSVSLPGVPQAGTFQPKPGCLYYLPGGYSR